MFLLYHAYVYLEFLILACTIYILAPVGGLIECTALTEEIDLICNEEGWLIGLEPRVAIPESETIIAGDCFICRHDRRGNFQSIREEDIPLIESKVQYITEEMLLRLALLKYFGML